MQMFRNSQFLRWFAGNGIRRGQAAFFYMRDGRREMTAWPLPIGGKAVRERAKRRAGNMSVKIPAYEVDRRKKNGYNHT